jgi:hypothetical protein
MQYVTIPTGTYPVLSNISYINCRALPAVDGGEEEEQEGVWETYMKISKRPPLQEVQLQHTYANIRQAVQSMFVSC